jgi:hypothetical protein
MLVGNHIVGESDFHCISHQSRGKYRYRQVLSSGSDTSLGFRRAWRAGFDWLADNGIKNIVQYYASEP